MNVYEQAGRDLLRTEDVHVYRYLRDGSSRGWAYPNRGKNGYIVCSRPKGPISFSILAHEVGHIVLGHQLTDLRWRIEIEAWEYALDQLDLFDLKGYERAEQTAFDRIHWYIENYFEYERIKGKLPGWLRI
jgi:hypothetical protein